MLPWYVAVLSSKIPRLRGLVSYPRWACIDAVECRGGSKIDMISLPFQIEMPLLDTKEVLIEDCPFCYLSRIKDPSDGRLDCHRGLAAIPHDKMVVQPAVRLPHLVTSSAPSIAGAPGGGNCFLCHTVQTRRGSGTNSNWQMAMGIHLITISLTLP